LGIRRTCGTSEPEHSVKLEANVDMCIGSGQCVLVEPALFTQSDEDLTVVLLQPDVPDELLATAKQAVAMCPNHVLSLVE
jgi:ferredoxin